MNELFHLLTDVPHWAFEVITDLVIGVLGGAVIWPRIRRHIHRDTEHAEIHAFFDATGDDVKDLQAFDHEVHAD